jgi:hypothetical protein
MQRRGMPGCYRVPLAEADLNPRVDSPVKLLGMLVNSQLEFAKVLLAVGRRARRENRLGDLQEAAARATEIFHELSELISDLPSYEQPRVRELLTDLRLSIEWMNSGRNDWFSESQTTGG